MYTKVILGGIGRDFSNAFYFCGFIASESATCLYMLPYVWKTCVKIRKSEGQIMYLLLLSTH